MKQKIQKILSKYSIHSRRKIEKMILKKKIYINNKIVLIGEYFEEKNIYNIKINNNIIKIPKKINHRMIILNKKIGQICTKNKNHIYPTIFDNLPKIKNSKWINVGRLDINTSGLLLFSTDGELTYRLMHPKYNIQRIYKVRVFGKISYYLLQKLKNGIWYKNKFLFFKKIFFLKGNQWNKWFIVTLHQGRNREVRNLWSAIGIQVNKLIRIKYGNIILPKSLKQGEIIELNMKQINQLRNLVQLSKI